MLSFRDREEQRFKGTEEQNQIKNGVFSLFGKISDCEFEEQGSIPENTQNNWEDNGGCLPALDAGGRRFESYFSDSFFLRFKDAEVQRFKEFKTLRLCYFASD